MKTLRLLDRYGAVAIYACMIAGAALFAVLFAISVYLIASRLTGLFL